MDINFFQILDFNSLVSNKINKMGQNQQVYLKKKKEWNRMENIRNYPNKFLEF